MKNLITIDLKPHEKSNVECMPYKHRSIAFWKTNSFKIKE